MPGLDVVGQVAGHPGHLEHLAEVVGLAGVGDVDDPVRVQLTHPTPDRRQICAGVTEAAVALAHDERGLVAIHPHHERAVVDHGDAALLEVGGDQREVVVVAALPGDVGVGEEHVKPLVGGVEPGHRHGDELTPDGSGLLVAVLKADHPQACGVGEVWVGAEVGVGALVERLGTGQIERADVQPLGEHLLHEHAELGAPVADVVLRDDGVAEGTQHAVEAVADDGGAEVAHVHLLGHIGRGVVDDDSLGMLLRRDTVRGVGEDRGGRLGEHGGLEPDVDEAWAGDLQRLAQVVELNLVDDVLGDDARRALLLLGEAQGDVRLEVPELRFGGRAEFGIDADDITQTLIKFGRQRRHGDHLPTADRVGCLGGVRR